METERKMAKNLLWTFFFFLNTPIMHSGIERAEFC